MNNAIQSWRRFLKENEEANSSKVAKIVLLNSDNHALFLKRTDYMDKFAGEWDLPGGHVHIGESLKDGLAREVMEETSLVILRSRLFTRLENLYFFEGIYEQGRIILSNEHSEYQFRDPTMIKNPSKFEKIAQMVVKNA